MNPHMLTKVRSDAIMAFPKTHREKTAHCSLRLCTFVQEPCMSRETLAMCHLDFTIGKGMGTKVSDILTVCACAKCHDLLAGVDPRGHKIRQQYPTQFWQQVLRAHAATLSMLVQAEIITVPDGELL